MIDDEFDALQAALAENAASMPPSVAATLQAHLNGARTLYESGSLRGAILKLTGFSQYVETHGGADTPDVSVANDPATIDVAALLRSGAETLKLSLDRKAGGAALI